MKVAWLLLLHFFLVPTNLNASPVREGTQSTETKGRQKVGLDLQSQLKKIREQLEAVGDGGEYRHYWEELAANNPDKDLANAAKNIGNHRTHQNEGIRSRLDELQRLNIEEMKQLHRQQVAGNHLNGLGIDGKDRINSEDLKRKLEKHRQLQMQIDKARREQFKHHEMKLEHLRRQKLKEMDEAQRLREEDRIRNLEIEKKEHEKLIHPGSRKQLQDVWRTQDELQDETFDPRTFFYLHDANGDQMLDPFEIESLFLREVQKVYGDSGDEMMMREELSEMREHVISEVDQDRDGLVSIDEFLQYSNLKIFDVDEEWKPLQEKEVFTDEDMKKFEEHYDDYKYEYEDYDADELHQKVQEQIPMSKDSNSSYVEKGDSLNGSKKQL